jgi:hypothetical protein
VKIGIVNEEDVNNEEDKRKEKGRVKRVSLRVCIHIGEKRQKSASRENISVPSSVTGKI